MAVRRAAWRCLGLAAALLAGQASAFGPQGHLIAGVAAEPLLCAEARARIDALGGGLGELGLWADRVRSTPAHSRSAPWHYMNIDDAGNIGDAGNIEYVGNRDDAGNREDPGGIESAGSVDYAGAIAAFVHRPEGDVLWAIERFRAALADESESPAGRDDALRFLIHFVVDIHQPLHVGRAEDRGGNAIELRVGGAPTNLHRFWDTDAITLTGLPLARYAGLVAERAAGAVDTARFAPRDWAAESLALRAEVYAFDRDAGVLTGPYIERALATTEDRLVLAAARLAATLNGIYCAER